MKNGVFVGYDNRKYLKRLKHDTAVEILGKKFEKKMDIKITAYPDASRSSIR